MSLDPDMFQYEGPLDLTEYSVSKTELRAETGCLVRVKVNTAWCLLEIVLRINDSPYRL